MCRKEIRVWLASIGAERTIPARNATHLPTMTDDDWQRLQPKAGKSAAAAKETAEKPKEVSTKSKQGAPKPKEAAATKTKDAASKPKGRPRCVRVIIQHTQSLLPFQHYALLSMCKCMMLSDP